MSTSLSKQFSIPTITQPIVLPNIIYSEVQYTYGNSLTFAGGNFLSFPTMTEVTEFASITYQTQEIQAKLGDYIVLFGNNRPPGGPYPITGPLSPNVTVIVVGGPFDASEAGALCPWSIFDGFNYWCVIADGVYNV